MKRAYCVLGKGAFSFYLLRICITIFSHQYDPRRHSKTEPASRKFKRRKVLEKYGTGTSSGTTPLKEFLLATGGLALSSTSMYSQNSQPQAPRSVSLGVNLNSVTDEVDKALSRRPSAFDCRPQSGLKYSKSNTSINKLRVPDD